MSQSTARRAFLEFLVIVVGVLAALAVDEWRTRRADFIREGEILTDLLEEFRENRTTLSEDLEWNRQRQAAGQDWVALTRSTSPVSQDAAVAVWERLRVPYIFQPVSGVIQSVIDAGELQLITNRDLRARVAGWPGLASEVTEIHRLNNAFVGGPILSAEAQLGPLDDPATILAALNDDTLNNLHIRFNRTLVFSVARGDGLMSTLDGIIAALEAEIASR